MTLTWTTALTLFPLVFLAGFIDSVAGGGGLISLPAYYLTGMPAHMAAGTNKLSACIGTAASSWKYLSGGRVHLKIGLTAALLALPGSWLGTSVQLMIPQRTVRIMMIIMIPLIALVVLRQKPLETSVRKISDGAILPCAAAIGLSVGFYDGLVGPGTGAILIVLFTGIMGMDTVGSSATAKIVNLSSNVAATVTYLITSSQNVVLVLGLPAALCGIAGNLLGAGMTMKRGAGFVRKMLLVVLTLLLAKMVYDVVK